MDRTLFSPSMIDTFRACKRAYEVAQSAYSSSAGQPSKRPVASLCRQFLRKGIAEINRGKITNPNEVQTFMGRHWPLEHVEKSGADPDSVARAFLYCYKTLMAYARSPYRPAGAEVVAVALKARSRVAHVRVYLEDTFDLILWYPEKKQLEIVEYQLRSKRHFSASWPTVSALVKRFLCERLRVRWPFETVSLTTVKIGATSATAANTTLDEAVYKLHFDEIVKDLENMKSPTDRGQHAPGDNCKFCESLSHRTVQESEAGKDDFLSLTA
ncbi:MAG: hypothetical protein SGJ27_10755 [Candidatus Melainabacteria bacterium]|nr:hypothetical protein [Candidatus Melainabacteria bacterium]